MAEIVLGIGTSHSPLLAIPPRLWTERAQDDLRRKSYFLADGRVVSYQELETETGARFADGTTEAVFARLAQQTEDALAELARTVAAANLDALIVIGDDQGELFSPAQVPALAIYSGDEIVTHPKNEVSPGLPEWYREANKGYKMDAVHRYPATPELAAALIEGLIADGVDVTVAREVADPHRAGFGHAFGFVIDRFCGDLGPPILPVMLNTYFPPNVPRPGRCYQIGEAIRRTVEKLPGGERIGIVASGGLTHFAVDEELDRTVIRAFETNDRETLEALPPSGLRSGNSEILNWIVAAGALAGLGTATSRYMPVHRTAAGTGIGLAFATRQP